MSVDTVKRVAELLRAARVDGACDDPAYFEQKAATWDEVAAAYDPGTPSLYSDPARAAEARRFAEAARERARKLRGAT